MGPMERDYIPGEQPVPGYRLVKFLGRGGFGSVWKATGPGGIDVALKIIGLDSKQGFKEFRAIRMMRNVRNAHLVQIFGFWLKDSGGNIFDETAESDSFILKGKATELIIAMTLGEKSLMDRLEECEKSGQPGIPVEELLGYMDGAAKAIDYLNRPIHNSGSGPIAIQHCDIKPQNILIVAGDALLCDFGLARVLGDPRTTQSGGMMSVPYTPPEIFIDSKPSQTSDQYALAVSYVELRTGQLPFENITHPAGLIGQVMQGKLDLSRLPAPEREVIKKATALDPGQRYATSLEMVRELRRVIEGVPSRASGTKVGNGPEVPGMEIVPGYKLVRKLGQGGYGTVWEANAPGGIAVAIKVINHVEKVSGQQEFKALELIKRLRNKPHLLQLQAYWLKDKEGGIIPDDVRGQPGAPLPSTLVIATELATKNLLERLNECQREGHDGIPVPELLRYLRQAAQAIDFLNEPRHKVDGQVLSIQHRDIKPENILLVDDMVKVGDFGLAKVLEGTMAQVHANSIGYTPYYAAPELFGGQVSRWTDQYSLALTYFKLRTGRMPFEANIAPGELMLRHVEGKLDLSALGEAERAVIARATAPTGEKRYPTCMDMVNALDRCLSGAKRVPTPPKPPTEPVIIPPPVGTPRQSGSTSGKPKTKPPAFDRTISPPEEEMAPVMATVLPQEEAEEGIDAVQASATISRSDTPVPSEPPPTAPGWRPQTQRDNGTLPGIEPRPMRSKAPVGILVAVLLLAGGGVGFLAWQAFSKGKDEPPVAKLDTRKDTGVQEGTEKEGAGETKPGDTQRTQTARVGTGNGDSLAKNTSRETTRRSGTTQTANVTPATTKRPEPDLLQESRAQARKFLEDHPVSKDTTPESLQAILKDLKNLRDLQRKLQGDPVGGDLKKRGAEAVQALLAKINDVIELAPQSSEEQIKAALEQAKAIAAYDEGQYQDLPGQKRKRAVDLLVQAAGEARRMSPANPLLPPWSDQDIDQVYEWLNTAYHLAGDNLPEADRKALVLAAGAKEDGDTVRKLLAKIPLTKEKEEIPYLLAKAQSQPLNPRGYQVAFETYADLLELATGQKDIPVRDLYNKVLGPALDSGEKAVKAGKGEIKERLANCYRAKARLIAESPGSDLGTDERRERLDCYIAAARHWPTPETLLDLSKMRREWALFTLKPQSPEQRDYLRKALADLGDGPPKHPKPDLVYYQRGLTLEDLAVLFKEKGGGEKEPFEKAIQAYRQAIQVRPDPLYLLALGRSRYKQGRPAETVLGDPDRMQQAREALKQALVRPGLGPEQRCEARYWSGMTWMGQRSPRRLAAVQEFDQALAEAKGRLTDFYKKTLEALEQLGRGAYVDFVNAKGKDDLQAVFDCCLTLIQHASEYQDKDNYVYYKLLGLNTLAAIGRDAYGLNVAKPTEVLKVFRQALPEDLTRVTDPGYIRLLVERNLICVTFPDELKRQGVPLDLPRLTKEVEATVRLAGQLQGAEGAMELLRAHFEAAKSYKLAMDEAKDKGQQQQALEFKQRGIEHAEKCRSLVKSGAAKSSNPNLEKEIQSLDDLAQTLLKELR